MAAEKKDQQNTFPKCDTCKNQASFSCRRCNFSLCDTCVPGNLREKAISGHNIIEYGTKDEDEECICELHPPNVCSTYCKTCDVLICKRCVSKHVEKTVRKLHYQLNDMRNEHEAALQSQKKDLEEMIKDVDEINKKVSILQKSQSVKELQNFVPIFQKQKSLINISQYPFPTFYACEFDQNDPTFFGYIEKEAEKCFSALKGKLEETELRDLQILERPTLTSVIDSGFPSKIENENRLYDLAITDDNKVWMGGHCQELKLFDLQGNLLRTVHITCLGLYICVHSNHAVYTDYADRAVKMISDSDAVVTMFTTKDWRPQGVTSTESGDLLVCLELNDQSKVVRYSSTGTVLQNIQYDSYCQPLYKSPQYIAENINGDIIVSDWKKDAVIAVNRLGVYRYSFSWEKCKSFACSVATDSIGQVIISDCNGIKIRILDRDGRFLRYIVLEDGIKKSRGLCTFGHGEIIVGESITGIAKRIKYT